MQLKPGSRWQSTVCETEVITVRPASAPVALRCGGELMVPAGERPAVSGAVDPAHSGGVQVGKRYSDEESGTELLCVKSGKGSLTVDGRPVVLRAAKKLPSSD